MISFKQFLIETWKIHNAADVEHYKKVDGHQVRTTFIRGGKDKDHQIDYTVNDRFAKKKGGAGPAASKRIIQHVGDRVDQFVRHAKPKAVSFGASDDRNDMHSAYAKHLARRHGGTHHDDGKGLHTVSFDRKKAK